MIDPKDVPFVEGPQQQLVECQRRLKIVPEGFLDDDACAVSAPGGRELLDYLGEQRRGDGEIVCGVLRIAQSLAHGTEGLDVRVVAVDILEQGRQLVESRPHPSRRARLTLCPCALSKLIQLPAGFRYTDDRDIQGAVAGHYLQGGKIFL